MRGFGWVESMLVLVVFSVATGAIIRVWVQDHQIQRVQRQTDVLQTARLASQRLITLYRNNLASTAVSPTLTTKVDGTALTTPINSTAGAGGTNLWNISVSQLIDLQLLDSNFPVKGVYGSLINAGLQLNLTVSRSDQKVVGTLCYDQPLTQDGRVDLSALGALQTQVSRSVSALGTGPGNDSSFQSGVFVASYPGDGSHLKGSASGISIPNPIAGNPEGIVCGLVGDWGGLENTGRSSYATATLGAACTEPNALAWLRPDSGSSQPLHALWCNGSNWQLFHGAKVGDSCTAGTMAVNADSASTTYMQPLMCGPSNTLVVGRAVPLKESLTCNSTIEGLLATGQTDRKIYLCRSGTWENDIASGGKVVITPVTTDGPGGDTCGSESISPMGYRTSDNKILLCQGGIWITMP
jgi:type II secretory pathway pseudopilin PulG